MKRFLFATTLLVASVAPIHAQLKVTSNGKVGIQTLMPQYGSLEIGKTGVSNGLSIYDSQTDTPPFKLYSENEFGYLNFEGIPAKGITIRNDGHIGLGYNRSIYPSMSSFLNIYIHPSNAESAFAAYANFNVDYGDVVKVYAQKDTDMAYVVRRGMPASSQINFYARGDGEVYAKGSYLTASDESFKENINSISQGLEIVKAMRGVTYTMTEDTVNEPAIASAENNTQAERVQTIEKERKRVKAGFIAQELEKVFPEAVYTLPDGKKAIAYTELIPVLTEAIKEQQLQIEAMQEQLETIQPNMNQPQKNLQNNFAMPEECAVLYANTPNPFNRETKIAFYIPTTIQKATLHIFNLQGKQIRQFEIAERNNASILISGHEFEAGMYIYTLVVDGQEAGSHRMILTE